MNDGFVVSRLHLSSCASHAVQEALFLASESIVSRSSEPSPSSFPKLSSVVVSGAEIGPAKRQLFELRSRQQVPTESPATPRRFNGFVRSLTMTTLRCHLIAQSKTLRCEFRCRRAKRCGPLPQAGSCYQSCACHLPSPISRSRCASAPPNV